MVKHTRTTDSRNAARTETAASILAGILTTTHGAAGIRQARAAQPGQSLQPKSGEGAPMNPSRRATAVLDRDDYPISTAVMEAYREVIRNLDALTAMAFGNVGRCESLPTEDHLAKATADLTEPVKLYIADYLEEGSQQSLQTVIQLSYPQKASIAISMMVAVESLLFLNGHHSVGIILLGDDGCGVILRYKDAETIESRPVARLPLYESKRMTA